MKLRDRLLLFSTAQLAVLGVLFGLAYGAFHGTVLPLFQGLMRTKSERVARMIAAELEVPIGAQDRTLIGSALTDILADPDFAYVEIRDAKGDELFRAGAPPHERMFTGPELIPEIEPGHLHTWAPVSYEGLRLGAVSLTFSTARFDGVAAWGQRIAAGGLVLWLAALAYSVVFARSFTTPIRAMMVFSRRVAGGALSERLETDAAGELRELRDYLNQMTADLERREHERRTAAEHAERMQGELLSVSRLAGMAEIATGVLHNVGNVLNSLNVSVSMISDQVRSSRVAGLTRSLELVDRFPGGLPAFLDTDKGKVLPTYLSSVSKRLSEENARMLEELGSVNRHVDHIKAIVAMQQSYAQPTGVREPVEIGALIDDALHLGEASFARHGIEVVKDYDRALTVVTDRHKLLQIMINLISNARHALKAQRGSPQQLTVRVRRGEAVIAICVIDTGIGIPPENLEQIFRHGFTTKQDGHGFGLHASANAARELGGDLQAASAGPGRGATFTLELPHALAN